MVAANKGTPLFSLFMSWSSEALYKILAGEHDRVKKHLEGLGMTPEQIKNTRKRVWRRFGRYSCPPPSVIIRGLLDIYCFFENMEDPLRPGHKVLTGNAERIFKKELQYVCFRVLSDKPWMNMYVRRCICKTTGLILFRCLRTSSPLEGLFFHLRLSQSALAKGGGLELENARGNLFDLVWTIKAAIKAGKMKDVGHYNLWMVDSLHDMCTSYTGGNESSWPDFLKGWSKVDNTIEPLHISRHQL
jgi:hypothetical protein